MTLTPEQVRASVAAIGEHRWPGGAWDDEAAHAAEDRLHRAVLAAICRGDCEDYAACAFEALRTSEHGFRRVVA